MRKRNLSLDIFGLHGSSHTAPRDTMVAYWAAMGAGGDGFVAGLQLSKSGSAVCCPAADLRNRNGESIAVLDFSDEALRDLDAGARFRSTVLDAEYQPTGGTGSDFPMKSWTRALRTVLRYEPTICTCPSTAPSHKPRPWMRCCPSNCC
jgi:hypothetical protein